MPSAPKKVIVRAFGGVDNLESEPLALLSPGPGEVLVDLTSVGMNQADLMARRGEYRLSSGEPPFTPGIEGGGIISAVGSGVEDRTVGQRVILTLGAPAGKGTYCSQFLALATETLPVPAGVPFLFDPAQQLAACGDWCLGSKVEAAFSSASALADEFQSLSKT